MSDALTRPEIYTARGQPRSVRQQVYARRGCPMCVHRLEGWGLTACEAAARTFPRCLHTPGLQFELDPSTVERAREC